jgi:hypothetical protein
MLLLPSSGAFLLWLGRIFKFPKASTFSFFLLYEPFGFEFSTRIKALTPPELILLSNP